MNGVRNIETVIVRKAAPPAASKPNRQGSLVAMYQSQIAAGKGKATLILARSNAIVAARADVRLSTTVAQDNSQEARLHLCYARVAVR
jgi:hypothetical protein